MKNTVLIITGLIVLFLSIYWFKCRVGINVFESSVSQYFPFKYLQGNSNHIIENPKIGMLLKDSFEVPFWSAKNWAGLWAREKNLVVSKIDDCVLSKTRCLNIVSESKKDWAYQHINIIKVKEGEQFQFKGRINNAADGDIYLKMVAYDENMKVLDWNYAGKKIVKGNDWVETNNEFSITEPIKYIRFSISGSGIGHIWVDDILFEKIK